MAGEVFHHVVDGFEHCFVVTLHGEMFRETFRRERYNDGHCLIYGTAKMLCQTRPRETAPSCELRIALADIRLPAHAGNDPLPYVSAQMQHQVAYGVFGFRAARPDLLLRQTAQAIFNAAAKLPQLARGEIEEHAIRGIHTQPG